MFPYISTTVFSFLTIYFVSKISYRLNLLDIPSDRKKHKRPVPYTGGVALGLIFLFIVLVTDYRNQDLNLILTYSFLISVFGLIDDKYNVSVGAKLCLEIIPILVLIFFTNLIVYDLGNYSYN